MQNKNIFYTLGAVLCFLLFYFFFLSPPNNFPLETIFEVEKGSSLRTVSLKLKNENIIRSRLVFEAFVILFDKEKRVIRSDYYFKNKLSVYEVARRISKGEHHLVPIAVTIPEGFNSVQIADVFVSKLLNFDKNKFLLEAIELEGYLFPDTYFFFVTADEQDALKSINGNFDKKIAPLRSAIIDAKKTEKEIITMASLIEAEAKGDADREFISGILWKRLSIGIPLQVDVSPETYKTKGLPKSPIGNPGLESIKAAIFPQNSPYLYYLHDKDGNIHYARSFLEHRQNVLKYLK